MIGLDATDVDYLQSRLDAFPHLQRLTQVGTFHRLKTPAFAMSASVWPTFYTGKHPGEHGVYFPMQFHAESMRLRRVSDAWLYCEPFWYELSRRGIPVTTFDVQTQFPSRIPLGVEITNWGAQSFSKLHTNRPDLVRGILRRYGKHPMRHDIPQAKTADQRQAIKGAAISGLHFKKEISISLMRETDWRLFLTVFAECHRAGHYLWAAHTESGTDNTLLEVFQELDSAVGTVLDNVDLATTMVIVFAVHGMGPNHTQMQFVPQVMNRINAEFNRGKKGGGPHKTKVPRRNPMRMLRESLPPGLQTKIAETVPEPTRDWVVSREFTGGLNWTKTPGFAMPTGGEAFIRFNVKGRERRGILEVGSERYAAYRDWVTRCFHSLRLKDTGEEVVYRVYDISDEFPGERRDRLPDLVVTWNNLPPATELGSDLLGTFHAELKTGRTGNHRADGFAIVGGHVPERVHGHPLTDIQDLSQFVCCALDGGS